MLSSIKSIISELNHSFPNWDTEITRFLEDDIDSEHPIDNKILDSFSEILNQSFKYVKLEGNTLDDIMSIFKDYDCKEFVSQYLNARLKTLESYKPLRDLEKDDIYKAKFCVDLMWSSFILRFNPYLSFDKNVPLSKADFKKVAKRLDQFTDLCISRGFCLLAIVEKLKEESCMSDSLCNYIAEKIDTDFEKLKLNYIIYKISNCEESIQKLSKDDLKK